MYLFSNNIPLKETKNIKKGKKSNEGSSTKNYKEYLKSKIRKSVIDCIIKKNLPSVKFMKVLKYFYSCFLVGGVNLCPDLGS